MHFGLLWKTPWNRLQVQITPQLSEARDRELCFTQPLTESRQHQSSYWITATEKSPLSLQSCIFPSFFQCHGLLCYVSERKGGGRLNATYGGGGAFSFLNMRWREKARGYVRWTDLGPFYTCGVEAHSSWNGGHNVIQLEGNFLCRQCLFARACIDIVEMQWPYALRQ